MLLHPRLVDLHHVGAGREQILDLGVDGGGVIHRHRFLVSVVVVLRLLAHGERAGHRRLDAAVGIGAQHFQVAHLDRARAPDRADHARHRHGLPGAVDGRAGIFDVDAVERGGEAVGIAFAALLAVGDDVEAGALLIADREDRGVVLRRFKLVRRDQPEIAARAPAAPASTACRDRSAIPAADRSRRGRSVRACRGPRAHLMVLTAAPKLH